MDPTKTIEICYDGSADDGYCWFTSEGHEHNLLDIEGDYLTHADDLLAALDARAIDYSGHIVTLCIGDGAGQLIRGAAPETIEIEMPVAQKINRIYLATACLELRYPEGARTDAPCRALSVRLDGGESESSPVRIRTGCQFVSTLFLQPSDSCIYTHHDINSAGDPVIVVKVQSSDGCLRQILAVRAQLTP